MAYDRDRPSYILGVVQKSRAVYQRYAANKAFRAGYRIDVTLSYTRNYRLIGAMLDYRRTFDQPTRKGIGVDGPDSVDCARMKSERDLVRPLLGRGMDRQ